MQDLEEIEELIFELNIQLELNKSKFRSNGVIADKVRLALYGLPNYYACSVDELNSLEQRFGIVFSEKLKKAIEIIRSLDHQLNFKGRENDGIQSFMSEKCVIYLVEQGITAEEIEEARWDPETLKFESQRISDAILGLDNLSEFLYFYIVGDSYELLILNGPDECLCAHRVYDDIRTVVVDGREYTYFGYCLFNGPTSVFSYMISDLKRVRQNLIEIFDTDRIENEKKKSRQALPGEKKERNKPLSSEKKERNKPLSSGKYDWFGLSKFSIQQKLFFIDGAGALTTCMLLLLIFGFSDDLSDEARTTVYSLSTIALLFSMYSFSCFKLNVGSWRPLLKGIALANIAYCVLNGFFLSTFWNELTLFGVTYLALEIVIVLILATVELRAARR